MGAGVAVNGHDQFAQAKIVKIKMDLRLEGAGAPGFQNALQFDGRVGRDVERNLALQTEAAIMASAELAADDTNGVSS